MLLEKYAPKITKDIVGNPIAMNEIRKWLSSWKKGRALLVHGPTGCGKSASINLIAREAGYDVVDVHPDEARSPKDFLQSSMQQGIFSRKKILLFENIEQMSMRNFSDLLKNSGHPIICTVNDIYHLSAPVRKMFKAIKFDKISETDMLRFAEHVCRTEEIKHEHRMLEQIVRTSNGDVRSLLMDLEFLKHGTSGGYRDIEDNIFNTLKIIFRSTGIENSKIAMENSEKDAEELFQWIEQNVTEEYTDPETIATAYNYLSIADVFRSRIIRRQSWSLQKYFSSLSVYGISLAKKKPKIGFVSYKPPAYIRRSNDSALQKLSTNLHTSRRNSANYVQIIRTLVKRGSNICDQLGMDDREKSFILDR